MKTLKFASLLKACLLAIPFVLALHSTKAQYKVYTDIESALKNPLDVYILNLDPNYLPDSILKAKRDPNILYTYKSKGYRINSLSDSIVKLTNLKSLKLTNNNFTEIPDVVYKLVSLEELKIDFMGIKKVSPLINNLSNLKKLSLSSDRLKELPKEIGDLKNLTDLDISDNELENLPDEINNLTALKTLDIQGNKFNKIPNCIKSLPSLSMIELTSLRHVDFNDTINSLCSMPNLKEIRIGWNKLTLFPEWILCCSNLESLYMQDVSFTTFPSKISRLKKLQYLMVTNYDFQITTSEKIKVRQQIPWCKHITIK